MLLKTLQVEWWGTELIKENQNLIFSKFFQNSLKVANLFDICFLLYSNNLVPMPLTGL